MKDMSTYGRVTGSRLPNSGELGRGRRTLGALLAVCDVFFLNQKIKKVMLIDQKKRNSILFQDDFRRKI